MVVGWPLLQASSTFGSLGIPGSKRPGLPLSQCCSQQAKQQSTVRVGNSHSPSRPLLHSPMGSVPARSAIRSRPEQESLSNVCAHHDAVVVTGPIVAELGPLQHCQRAVPMAGRVRPVAGRVGAAQRVCAPAGRQYVHQVEGKLDGSNVSRNRCLRTQCRCSRRLGARRGPAGAAP